MSVDCFLFVQADLKCGGFSAVVRTNPRCPGLFRAPPGCGHIGGHRPVGQAGQRVSRATPMAGQKPSRVNREMDDVIASRGGNPLVVGGKVVGAIGVSGGTGSQDDVVSLAGVAALK
jgi:Haem-degrading